jgi:hypothetical protein
MIGQEGGAGAREGPAAVIVGAVWNLVGRPRAPPGQPSWAARALAAAPHGRDVVPPSSPHTRGTCSSTAHRRLTTTAAHATV